jgi:hypothetical protein
MQENKQEKSPIKDRILQYLETKGITKYAFYKDSGTTRGILDQETGISEENIARFLAYAKDVSPLWLLTGEGNMLHGENTHQVIGHQSIAGHGNTISGNVNVTLPERGFQKIIRSDGSETIVEVAGSGSEGVSSDLASECAALRKENKELLGKIINLQDRLLDGK